MLSASEELVKVISVLSSVSSRPAMGWLSVYQFILSSLPSTQQTMHAIIESSVNTRGSGSRYDCLFFAITVAIKQFVVILAIIFLVKNNSTALTVNHQYKNRLNEWRIWGSVFSICLFNISTNGQNVNKSLQLHNNY